MFGRQFGNVFIGVQPTFGYEGDPMRLLFSRSASPHHGFAAYYTYLEKIFKVRSQSCSSHINRGIFTPCPNEKQQIPGFLFKNVTRGHSTRMPVPVNESGLSRTVKGSCQKSNCFANLYTCKWGTPLTAYEVACQSRNQRCACYLLPSQTVMWMNLACRQMLCSTSGRTGHWSSCQASR